MSIPSDCCNPCPTTVAVNVPGTPGTNGVDAFTTTTAPFTLPAANASVPVSVANARWMALGQIIFVSDGVNVGTFQVAAVLVSPFTIVTLKFLDYPGDSTPLTTTISSGAVVTPSGLQSSVSVPLSVGNGGTGAITAGAARTSLGAAASGANSDITSLNGLTTPLSIAQGGTGAGTIATALANLLIQYGSTTLVNGTKTISLNVGAATFAVVALYTPGGTRTGWAGYVLVLTAGLPGTLQITAITDAAGNATVLNNCTDVVHYHVLGF